MMSYEYSAYTPNGGWNTYTRRMDDGAKGYPPDKIMLMDLYGNLGALSHRTPKPGYNLLFPDGHVRMNRSDAAYAHDYACGGTCCNWTTFRTGRGYLEQN